MKNADIPALDVSAGGGKANTVDLQIANAIQWLNADGHPHVADDMRDARAKVAALVEALKPFASLKLKSDWHDETPMALLVTIGDIRRADAALRAAGEVVL